MDATFVGSEGCVFCLSWTLSFENVLEFSTTLKETFDVEAEEFHA